jgi:hypothetical protein
MEKKPSKQDADRCSRAMMDHGPIVDFHGLSGGSFDFRKL